MSPDDKNLGGPTIEALCHHCGKEFSAFLHQMEEQNAKVVCPDCGKENDCPPPPKKTPRPVRKR
jgi:DNA-directed RNA polymerase subunit RPC12/RpoP